MNIIIKRLTEELLNDFLFFFDNKAFVDNPDWASCYCIFFHHKGRVDDWFLRSKEDNREEAIKLIKSRIMQGFMAYDDSVPIGWCNTNEKQIFSFDKNRKGVYSLDDSNVISIVCFIISHEYRKKGISKKLLQGVIDHYKNMGKEYIEAYPSKNVYKDSENYHGPISLYLKNGFYVEKELDEYFIVRYRLG